MPVTRLIARLIAIMIVLCVVSITLIQKVGSIQPSGTILVYSDHNFCSNGYGISLTSLYENWSGINVPSVLVLGWCMESNFAPSCSADGRLVTFIGDYLNDVDGLYTVTVNYIDDILPHPQLLYPGRYDYFDITSDGNRIALVPSLASEQRGELLILSPNDMTIQPVVEYEGQPTSPTWSPDGNHLAFITWTVTNDIYHYKLNIIDIERNIILQEEFDADYAADLNWSPNSNMLLVWLMHDDLNNPRSGIYIFDADGSDPTRLMPGNSPEWSPDGTQIAYRSQDNNGDWQIFVANTDGTQNRQVTTDYGDKDTVCWLL